MQSTSRTFVFRLKSSFLLIVALLLMGGSCFAAAQENPKPDAPVVQKVEPPNWWVGLTPDVMILLSGKNLNATRASCNLQDVIVNRTQSSSGGDYLFVWLKLNPKLKTGTAVCRISTPKGETAFELPFASRKPILGRNQGLAPEDVLYLIMPDRFANGDPTNDEPKEFPGSYDRSKPRAWHGGDLRGVREHLSEEELTIFDILTRPGPDLIPEQRDEVKKVARTLLEKVKAAIVLDWRRRAQSHGRW